MAIQMNERQRGTILAALRYWQAMHVDREEDVDVVLIDDIAEKGGMENVQ